jgi:hypothetical protein
MTGLCGRGGNPIWRSVTARAEIVPRRLGGVQGEIDMRKNSSRNDGRQSKTECRCANYMSFSAVLGRL